MGRFLRSALYGLRLANLRWDGEADTALRRDDLTPCRLRRYLDSLRTIM